MEHRQLSGVYTAADGSWIRWKSGAERRLCQPVLLEICEIRGSERVRSRFRIPDGSGMEISFLLRAGEDPFGKKDICVLLRTGERKEMWQDAWLRPDKAADYKFVQNFYADTDGTWIAEIHMSGEQGDWCAKYGLRENGLVELYCGAGGCVVVTEPIICTGRKLQLNYATSAAGEIRVGILRDAGGTPLCGYSVENCDLIYGNALDETVTFHGTLLPGELIGQKIRLKFKMRDASLFSFRFNNS